MPVRLWVKIGHPIGVQRSRDMRWPIQLPLPAEGDFVTIGEDELEVDHLEWFPEALTPHPLVGISFMPTDEIGEGWT